MPERFQLIERIAELEARFEEVNADNVTLANQRDELLDALEDIAEGCVVRPGHVEAGFNLTKAQIEAIARAAVAKVRA